MITIIVILGALLIAIGILMHGNRAGWFLFVVTPRAVLWLAAAIVVGVLALSHARAEYLSYRQMGNRIRRLWQWVVYTLRYSSRSASRIRDNHSLFKGVI